MKQSRFTDSQIINILKAADSNSKCNTAHLTFQSLFLKMLHFKVESKPTKALC